MKIRTCLLMLAFVFAAGSVDAGDDAAADTTVAALLDEQAQDEYRDWLNALSARFASREDAEGLLSAVIFSDARTLGEPINTRAASKLLVERAMHAAIAETHLPALNLLMTMGAQVADPAVLAEVRAHLRMHDAGNANIWMHELGLIAAGDDAAEAAVFAKLAQADHHHIFLRAAIPKLVEHAMTIPMPEAHRAMASRELGTDQPELSVGVLAMSMMMARAMPGINDLRARCRRDDAHIDGRLRAEHCVRIAKALAGNSDSVLFELFGLNIWNERSAHRPDAHLAYQAWRDHAWQLQAYSELRTGATQLEVQALNRREMQAMVSGRGERDSVQDELRAAGIPLTAPADWQPSR